MTRVYSHLKALTQVVFCITPLLLPLANGQILADDTPPIPNSKFTPPPPPKKVPLMVVKVSTVTPFQTHNLTLIRSEASTLPDIPPPPPLINKVTAPGREDDRHHFISISASVYDHGLSHVTWTNPATGKSFEAWCGWDFTLLSSIPQIDLGKNFSSFHLSASKVNTATEQRVGRKTEIPAHPAVTADRFIISKGDIADKDALVILTTLRNYYLKHKKRLILIKKAQQEYQAAADAWLKANPPKPESHTFWLKPHRGSRYLTQEGGR